MAGASAQACGSSLREILTWRRNWKNIKIQLQNPTSPPARRIDRRSKHHLNPVENCGGLLQPIA